MTPLNQSLCVFYCSNRFLSSHSKHSSNDLYDSPNLHSIRDLIRTLGTPLDLAHTISDHRIFRCTDRRPLRSSISNSLTQERVSRVVSPKFNIHNLYRLSILTMYTCLTLCMHILCLILCLPLSKMIMCMHARYFTSKTYAYLNLYMFSHADLFHHQTLYMHDLISDNLAHQILCMSLLYTGCRSKLRSCMIINIKMSICVGLIRTHACLTKLLYIIICSYSKMHVNPKDYY